MENVRERISIRNKNQFEIKYTYPLQLDQEYTEYQVETFVFLPKNLPITRKNYSKEEFYRDTSAYIRFKTPAFTLPDIIYGDDSPLERSRQSIENLIADPMNPEMLENFSYHLKMLCSILKSALRDEVERIENIPDAVKRDMEAAIMVDSLQMFIEMFRKLRAIGGFNALDNEKKTLFGFSEEYIGILSEYYLFKFLEFMDAAAAKGGPVSPEIRKKVVEMIKEGNAYRFKVGYPTIVRENSTNETFIYRMRMLKKIMGSILYIRTENIDDGKVAEQIAVNMAAGLAMALATIVILLFQSYFSNFAGWVIFTAVIAYLIRERMKESSRSFFIEWLRGHYFDYKTILKDNLNRKIGESKSVMTFLKPSKIPRKILSVRDQDMLTSSFANGFLEEVIYGKKLIRINNASCQTIWSDFKVDGINDIVRFNMNSFMSKMNFPERDLYILDGEHCSTVPGTGVYHLNLILRYGMGGYSEIHKFRLIMNRNGILRIIEVPVKQESPQ